ncbi:MAG: PepSY domain-containing protein [Patescibacteria group bacterium]|nr:PepSY domain-containing protein [Patescibacteria group bacterium]
MKSNTNRFLVPLAVLAIVGLGGSLYTLQKAGPTAVEAQTVSSAVNVTSSNQAENTSEKPDVTEMDNKTPSYTSSVTVSESLETNTSEEVKKLSSLAKISADQAKAAAEKATGGTASSVKLEDENGNVVYAVTVGSKEVKVDAGNGKILHTELADSGNEAKVSETEVK